jgi:hypothetical protein
MKKIMMLIGIFILTTSCVEINGRLQVHETFIVKKKSGFLNRKTKEVDVRPRSYDASLKFISDKNFTLKLDGGDLDNISVPLKAEKDLDIPFNGRFNISHETIGQPFDISGTINTSWENSGYNESLDSCSWSTTEKKCDKVCEPATGRCEVLCRDVTTTFNGKKRVEYHYSYTRRILNLEIMRANSTGIVATFAGSDIESTKVVDRESACW